MVEGDEDGGKGLVEALVLLDAAGHDAQLDVGSNPGVHPRPEVEGEEGTTSVPIASCLGSI
jgi:hypothetical protein